VITGSEPGSSGLYFFGGIYCNTANGPVAQAILSRSDPGPRGSCSWVPWDLKGQPGFMADFKAASGLAWPQNDCRYLESKDFADIWNLRFNIGDCGNYANLNQHMGYAIPVRDT
jgi:hypothetical protein